MKENKNKKRYSPNFKVVLGRFVDKDPKKKKVSSNVGAVSEQGLVAWPSTSGSHIRDLGWMFEIAGRIQPKGYKLPTPVLEAYTGFSKGWARRVARNLKRSIETR